MCALCDPIKVVTIGDDLRVPGYEAPPCRAVLRDDLGPPDQSLRACQIGPHAGLFTGAEVRELIAGLAAIKPR